MSSTVAWTTAPTQWSGSKRVSRSVGLKPFPGSEEPSKDEEAADTAAEGEKDGQDNHDGEEGGGEAPEEVRLALHLVVVPDHASRAGTLADDPCYVSSEP